MALAKITLKLGKKTIELTAEQFEELKADMRELDQSHNYYWHHSPWYSPWYNEGSIRTFTFDSISPILGNNGSAVDPSGSTFTMMNTAAPPAFEGSILSAQ